ncbi:MAG TPA: S8 family serine peptidase [Candidatus Acidoferrum sp.]|nr:S8 family serine peptidase [Candidatus Acidoferrum sp.]
MRRRLWFWLLACLLCLTGAWWLWHPNPGQRPKPVAPAPAAAPVGATAAASAAPASATASNAPVRPGPFAFRLSNTSRTLGQLTGDRHAILLENALIDSSAPLTLNIPAHLRSPGDPGAYIVQSRRPVDAAFRAVLAALDAEIVSYIPNNAYLVLLRQGGASKLADNPLTQAVLPYEPYFKIQSALLPQAVGQMSLPDGAVLTLGLFDRDAPATMAEIRKLGAVVTDQDRSPFGPIVRVQPPADWTALAALPGVQRVELFHKRVHANDLSRAALGVASDTLVPTNYLNLTGSNVLVQVNDTGIDVNHPDLIGRVLGSPTTDSDGHGTHVAGIIAGDGTKSTTVSNAPGSIIATNGFAVAGQFRGKAQLAKLLSVSLYDSDQDLQQTAAQTNALISNNSWNYGVPAYDLAAASYDAAVRDALPFVTGSQPVCFVFSAGNAGGGDDGNDPGSGIADSILSPATAKNVITVGALQELRNITNQVMVISDDGTVTNYVTPWAAETSTSYRIAGFSSRGNVGIGIEGSYGRFKPDVVAPGTFVISTRSAQWDVASYFYINPISIDVNYFSDLVLQPGNLWANVFPLIPNNTIETAVFVFPNADSPFPFPFLPIYFSLANATNYTHNTVNNQVVIPPDGGYTIADILNTQGFWAWNYGVSNNTANPISFDVLTETVTTNNPGDYFLVLSNLNQSIGSPDMAGSGPGTVAGPYYRYESGTSMSAADVSGVLALMQDFFTNSLRRTPSPALLKALLINGARPTGFYDFQVQNAINYEGWGQVNLPNSLPPGFTNQFKQDCASFYLDQDVTNALATGDSHNFQVVIGNTNALNLPLRITLAWTDPPGDPAAAIKLVNDLNLVVTNLTNPTNPIVYFGNDIAASSIYNTPESPTNAVYDSVNNVENVYLPAGTGTNFTICVQGYRVNVNAITMQTNRLSGGSLVYAPDVVQDFVLVVSCGEGEVSNAMQVLDVGPGLGFVPGPSSTRQVTTVLTTNAPLYNQFAGASAPEIGTNTVPLGANSPWGGTNAVVTLGMTNQWQFYVITNTGLAADYTNAGFITFLPATLSLPRMGVFAGSLFNSTRPEADIDLYVSTDPGLTNLDPAVIANCVHGAQAGSTAGGVFNSSSLGRGGTEFVADNNSKPGQVYYVGVYAEDQEASEYGFIPIFTDVPFSTPGPNGVQIVNGVPLPVDIPDGTPARPGHGYVFGLALYPMEVQRVVVTNTIASQNYGDLIGTLSHGGQNGLSQTMVLNNHVSLDNPQKLYQMIYDDSGFGDILGSRPTDGPGSLMNFTGSQANGPWIVTEIDDSLTQTSSVVGLNLQIEPHQDLTKGLYGTLGALGWFYGYVDVPPGATSLTIAATNLTATGIVDLFVRYGRPPNLTNYDVWVQLTNVATLGAPPGNAITIGPPIVPGRYWVGLYNESVLPQSFYIIATLGLGTAPQAVYTSSPGQPILDDAVTTAYQYVSDSQIISTMEVALRVNHPRVSDLVFHLISPQGTRVLLVENRGAGTTSGLGASLGITNVAPLSVNGGSAPTTNIITLGLPTGTLTVYYDFYSVPDHMVIYDSSGALIFDSGVISGSGIFNVAYTNSTTLAIVMNPGGGTTGTAWKYSVSAVQTLQTYLVLTEDTNKTTTPIKFAPIPFIPTLSTSSNPPPMHNSFEGAGFGDVVYSTGQYFTGWRVDGGSIDAISNPSYSTNSVGDEGTNWIDLDGFEPGTISTNVATVPGKNYTLSFTYSQNADGKLYGHPTASMRVLKDATTLLSMTIQQTNGWLNLGWTTTSVVFTATSNFTKLTFQSLDAPGDKYGVNLDCIDLVSDTFSDSFENTIADTYGTPQTNKPGFGSWTVLTNLVAVISNASLAHSGANLLALADGQIYRALPTSPGTKYTLSYAYRGPAAAGFWRGESNLVDSVYGNNGTVTVGTVAYAPAEVGLGITNNGSTNRIAVADSAVLDFGAGQDFSIDGWISPLNPPPIPTTGVMSFVDKRNAPNNFQCQGYEFNLVGGQIHCRLSDNIANNGTEWGPAGPDLRDGNLHHVALSVVRNSRFGGHMYVDGIPVLQFDPTPEPGNLTTAQPLLLGNHPDPSYNSFFNGRMDEITIYRRALSYSEVKAIYNHGSAGKFSTNAPTIPLGLAEAQITLDGVPQAPFFGDNTNWQTATITFIATRTNTPLVVAGIEPGMLLDDFSLTPVPTNDYNLYYLPEQSLDTLKGENAEGQWQLEIQDDRAGATNPAPSLASWQMHFIFTTPVPAIPALTNGVPLTNTIPPGGIMYFLVNVPTNADMATNILISPGGPLNLLWDRTAPPTGSTPPDYQLLGPTVADSITLTTTSFPTNIVPGGYYYLGVQNPNTYTVNNYSIQVNFHLVPPPLQLPQLPELLAVANQLFTVTNQATGGTPPVTNYVLTTSVPTGPFPTIDTNGVITWTPIPIQAPAVYTFTNIVSDSGGPPQYATNIFHVLVVLTNGLPAFPGAQGAGGLAIGGRGGDVYHVLNLNDSGPGSLRYGIGSTFGSRTIVFDVSGVIRLFSNLRLSKPYITIAGQTAPGAGITLQGLTTSVESTHDAVARFLRCRPGDFYSPYFQDDSFHFVGVTNSIADHLSATWSIDEALSTTVSTNISVQWSLIAEPLNHSAHYMDNGSPGFQAHGYGSLLRYGSGAVSYHHNLYADNYSRSPRLGDSLELDFINNVVCNWGIFCGYNANDAADNPGGYTNALNYVGNYVIAGLYTTANPGIAFASGVPSAAFTRIYQATNFIDPNRFNPALSGANTGWGMFSGNYTQLGAPTPLPEIPVSFTNPPQAYEQVLAFAGASVAGVTAAGTPAAGLSVPRDSVDANIVGGVRSKSGQIIDFISSNSFPGVYLHTNFGVTSGGYSNAAVYWVGQGFTSFVGVNPWPVQPSAPQPLDSDGDGIPDYWEITLAALGTNSMNPAVPNNNHSYPDGYTDLEHYINWLAGPHALTVTNTPVAVDLYALAGRTGRLAFSVGNATNGSVTLAGRIATFTPTNNYFGFASFDFSVFNLSTTNAFGPVTVSIMVSATNITTSSTPLTNGVPQLRTVPAGGIDYYLVKVPVNAQIATNILSAVAGGPLNLLYSQVGFPTGTNTGDYTLLAGSSGGIAILTSNSVPTNIVAGGTYYLGVQNPSGGPADYSIEVDFYPPPPTNAPPSGGGTPPVITSITPTNGGFLLVWYAPTNESFMVQWTDNLLPPASWNTVPGIITYTGPVTATDGRFTFFDDGSQTGGLSPDRFYRLILLQATNVLVLPFQTNQTVAAGTTLVVNNTATDSDPNAIVGYQLSAAPPGASISANGIITWTPSLAFVNTTNLFTTIATDDGSPMASATNSFTVAVIPPPPPLNTPIITATNLGGTNGFLLTWFAPTNDLFQVRWTGNLLPPVSWQTFTNVIAYAGPVTTGIGQFSFFDDGSQTGGFGPVRFYQLVLLGAATNAPASPVSISGAAVTTNGQFQLQWTAPTNYQFQVEWTTNLAPPAAWSTNAGYITSATTNFVFTDTNALTGGKFYRLIVYP